MGRLLGLSGLRAGRKRPGFARLPTDEPPCTSALPYSGFGVFSEWLPRVLAAWHISKSGERWKETEWLNRQVRGRLLEVCNQCLAKGSKCTLGVG